MFAARFAFQSPQQVTAGNARRTAGASTNAALTWTADNSATTSTTQFEFGTASLRLPNANSDINSASTTIGGMGTNDFAIECWIYIDTLANYPSNISNDIYSHDRAFGLGIRLAKQYNTDALGAGANAKYIALFAREQADLDYWVLPSTWPVGQWNFVAIQRKGSTISCWVNGTLLTRNDGPNGSASGYTFDTGSAVLRVGTADGANGLGYDGGSGTYAYIDEFCISNTYRYTDTAANIPVPTAPFTVDALTVQLLHMDGSNGGTTFTNATS
jgi:hypothetical protein